MESCRRRHDALAVDNCKIKHSQHSSDLEVVFNSELLKSPSKFNVSSEVSSGVGDISLPDCQF